MDYSSHSRFTLHPPESGLIISTCAHILDSGVFCNAPAAHRRRFCRHHVEFRTRCWRMARFHHKMRVRVPVLQDLAAVQLARARVRYALSAGRMSQSEAGLFFFALRMAADNIRFIEKQCWQQDRRRASP